MTKEELKEKFDGLLSQDNGGMNLYFILHKQNTYVLKKANVRFEALDIIKESLRENIILLRTQLDEADFSVMNLSVADGRSNAMYLYDLPDLATPIALMKEVEENLFSEDYFTDANNRLFDFDADSFGEIDAWIASYGVDGNHIITYRKTYHVNLLEQGRNMFVFRDHDQIDLLRNDIFRIDGKIDFFILQNYTTVCNLSILEKFNDFKDIVIRAAGHSIQLIVNADLVSDIAKLQERANTDVSFARKLIKVTTNSLILNVVNNEDIIRFAKEHAYLSRRLKVSDDNKFELEKKTSQNVFIQLLDDAFLHSQLSSNDYLSPGKDILRPEEENVANNNQ